MTAILKARKLSIGELSAHRGFRNRVKWSRGMQGCGICLRKIMAYLESGHTLDDVCRRIKEKHPEIVYVRKTAMDAIRKATGWGVYDDYIYKHNLWKLRAPILADHARRSELESHWKDWAEQGRELIEMDLKTLAALSKNDENAALIRHAIRRARSTTGRGVK